jgi:FHS family L-fucose permease-like MFS transporter
LQSFIINYLNDSGMYTKAQASQMFSYMQITFMVGRFASTPLLRFFNDATILAFYGTMCAVFSLVAALTGGKAGLGSLFIVFFFESVCYPTTFTLATSNLGVWTKRGASLVVMGVGGGAAFPPMQGALADARSTQLSYVINAVGFLTVACYGVGMRLYQRRFAHMLANASVETPVLSGSNSSKEKVNEESEKIETPTLHI